MCVCVCDTYDKNYSCSLNRSLLHRNNIFYYFNIRKLYVNQLGQAYFICITVYITCCAIPGKYIHLFHDKFGVSICIDFLIAQQCL